MSSSVEKLTDEQIVLSYQDTGRQAHVGELFSRYKHLVYGVCLKYLKVEEESRDALMDIFEKLLRDLSRQKIQNFKNWLYITTKHHCLDRLEKRGKTEERLEKLKKDEKNSSEFMEFSEEESLYNRGGVIVQADQLKNALKKLDEDQRICMDLFFIQDKRYKEIVAETNYTLNQVKSYLQNGKRNLKRLLLEEIG